MIDALNSVIFSLDVFIQNKNLQSATPSFLCASIAPFISVLFFIDFGNSNGQVWDIKAGVLALLLCFIA